MVQETLTVNPAEILVTLRSFPLLAPFHLTLLGERGEEWCTGPGDAWFCGTGENYRCLEKCREAVRTALMAGKPNIFRCPFGLVNFAVPVRYGRQSAFCLLGSGVREKAEFPALPEVSPDTLVEVSPDFPGSLESLPVVSFSEAETAAEEAFRLLPALLDKNLYAFELEQTSQRLEALAGLSTEIDRAETAQGAISLLGEALIILFELPRMAVVLTEKRRQGRVIKETFGLPVGPGTLEEGKIADFLGQHQAGKAVSLKDRADTPFPDIQSALTTCIPLVSEGRPLGLLAFFETDLSPRDLLLVELLAGRAAAKLLQLKKEDEHRLESSLAGKLISMISALSLMENREELHSNILEMGADLVGASRGSLMLFDESGENLRIDSVKGMNLSLAKSMSVKVGTGIAGRVAKSGFPLLVNDIEKDCRTASPNRPRFKTKSFISLPLRLKDQTVGVLNLADKDDQEAFNESDLNLLTTFAAQAALMIERIASLERASLLEKLSVTDALTGLFNRRFLEKRLEEELSRSSRQSLDFAVLLLDLDNFKIYNDNCGHIAGDLALKKTAGLLRSSAREMDIVTRYGGEEFCVLLPGTSKKDVLQVAERIRQAIEKEPFPREALLPLGKLTASIGISSYPQDGDSAQTLINAADIALYQAKNQGRNRVVPFDPSLQKNKVVFI